MGAGLTPHGFSVFHADVVHGTFPGALAAADAGVPRPEGGRFYEASIENRVHRAAHEAVIELVSRHGEGLPRLNAGDSIGNSMLAAAGWGALNMAI